MARWLIAFVCFAMVTAACGGTEEAEVSDLELAITLSKSLGEPEAFDAVLWAADRGYTHEQIQEAIQDEALPVTGEIDGVEPAARPAGVLVDGHEPEVSLIPIVAHVDDGGQLRADALEWAVANASADARRQSPDVAGTETVLYMLRSGFTGIDVFEAIFRSATLTRSEPCPVLSSESGEVTPRGCG